MPGVLFIVLGNFTSDVKLSNLFLVGFVDNPADYYLNADLIITQAGHSTAMELITLGLPMLVVPDTYQVEQESNAKRLCELGIATKLSYKELNSGALFDQVQHMIEEPAYAASAKEISKLARNYIAEEEAANIIRDYSARIQAY